MRKRQVKFGLCLVFFLGIFLIHPLGIDAQEEAKPPATTTANPDEEEIEEVIDDLNTLQEDIFRSKARTLLLQEFLANTEVEIYFKNANNKHFRLKNALYLLDNSEIFKKEFGENGAAKARKEEKIFSGVTTPGRHEVTVALVFVGTRSGGYTENDYEFQVTGDFAFVAIRGEKTVVTISARDFGKISQNLQRSQSRYDVDLDVKIESAKIAAQRRRQEQRRFGVMVESGFLVESFQLVSTQLSVNQQFDALIPFGGRVYWYFWRDLGVEAYYTYASWNAGTGVGGQTVDMTMSWFGFDAKWRHKFTSSIYSPTIVLLLGYNFFETEAGQLTNPTTRLTDDYDYMDVGLELFVPFHSRAGVKIKGLFFPFVDLDESPVRTGADGNPYGFDLEAGLYWNFWKDFSVEARYMLLFFDNDFTGLSTRTDQFGNFLSAAQTRAFYQGGILGLKYEF